MHVQFILRQFLISHYRFRESKDALEQYSLQSKSSQVWAAINLANGIQSDGLRETIRDLVGMSNAATVEIEQLKNRYNSLVQNVDAYMDAVNNYVQITQSIFSRQPRSTQTPIFNFNFVHPQPITCSGDTLAFTNATAYLNETQSITNATTTIHCQ